MKGKIPKGFLQFYRRYLYYLLVIAAIILFPILLFGFKTTIVTVMALISVIFIVQAIFTLIWMTYAWNDPKDTTSLSKTKDYEKPKTTFSIFIPALHEEGVIGDTIKSMSRIDYPKKRFEVFVINRSDDAGTIGEVKETITELRKKNFRNIKHLIPEFRPKNKPDKLNYALTKAKNDVVVIFDAEDQVHPDILRVMNTHFIRSDADIIQGGVQLMNYRSTWFSALNCLEYYYWFKSALHFFSKFGVTPLGGVTVFFKKDFLDKVGGWDAECLTEDADIGFRMSVEGAKISVVYDHIIATRESTPLTVKDFVKQRTRWDLGFIQILAKGQWKELRGFWKKVLALYVLFTPIGQSVSLLFIPFMVIFSYLLEVPVGVSLLTLIPFFLLLMIMFTQIIILYDFTKSYELKYPIWMPLKILIVFFPYVMMLSAAAVRGILKYFSADFAWEKTPHNNTHREVEAKGIPQGSLNTELE